MMMTTTTAYARPGMTKILREPLPQVPEGRIADLWLERGRRGALFTSLQGEQVRIIHPGMLNFYDGPDFTGALVEINGEALAGPVEIHRRVEDWFLHKHQHNPRYRNVVLHVVLYPPDGPLSPALPSTIVLAAGMSPEQRRKATLGRKPEAVFHACLSGSLPDESERMAALVLASETRFVRKRGQMTSRAMDIAGGVAPDAAWLQCLYEALARALGYGGNADALQQFATDVPLALLRSITQEAPHKGVREVFETLAATRSWQAKSVRPGNRIGRRLEHFSFFAVALLEPGALQRVLAAVQHSSPSKADELLAAWLPDAASAIGPERSYEIAINVLAPWAAAYAAMHAQPLLEAAALRLYFRSANPPGNTHTRAWQVAFGFPSPWNSGVQQGIIELRTGKCAQRSCSICLLGGKGPIVPGSISYS